ALAGVTKLGDQQDSQESRCIRMTIPNANWQRSKSRADLHSCSALSSVLVLTIRSPRGKIASTERNRESKEEFALGWRLRSSHDPPEFACLVADKAGAKLRPRFFSGSPMRRRNLSLVLWVGFSASVYCVGEVDVCVQAYKHGDRTGIKDHRQRQLGWCRSSQRTN